MLRYALLAVAAALLLSPVSAETPKCYICDTGDEGAECDIRNIASFARSVCEERRLCTQQGCRTICVTSGGFCTIRPPGQDPWPFLETLLVSTPPTAPAMIAETFDSWVVGLLGSRPLQGKHLGRCDGMVSLEDGRAYRFSGDVRAGEDGLITATYKIEDHPAFTVVTIESPSHGEDVFITAEQVDGGQRFEAFNFTE